jgi:hypothetical protein
MTIEEKPISTMKLKGSGFDLLESGLTECPQIYCLKRKFDDLASVISAEGDLERSCGQFMSTPFLQYSNSYN